MERNEIETIVAELGLSVSAVFVPWSQSRNKNEKYPSLNWRVTLKRGDREILTTDYAAGFVHCPAYKNPEYSQGRTIHGRRAIERECENGRAYLGEWSKGGTRILPDTLDVLCSLTLDASVLDSSGFEEWASEIGYDVDSRKAEAAYRACLEIALKLRAGIGDDGLAKLRDALSDY
jgi:hypothetical protein